MSAVEVRLRGVGDDEARAWLAEVSAATAVPLRLGPPLAERGPLADALWFVLDVSAKALSSYLRAQARAASDRFMEVAGQEPGAAVGEAVALRWKTAVEGLLDRVRNRSTPAAVHDAGAETSTAVGAARSGLLVDADTGVGYVLEPGLPLEAYRSVLEGPPPQRGPLQWRDGEWQLTEQQQPPR